MLETILEYLHVFLCTLNAFVLEEKMSGMGVAEK